MSKPTIKDAESCLHDFKVFFSQKDFMGIDQLLAINKKLNETIINTILSKYSDPDDEKINLDPNARTMLLVLMRILYYSANNNGFDTDGNPSAHRDEFTPGEIEYNLWTWVSGLIHDCGGWDIVMEMEIHPYFDTISAYHIASEIVPIEPEAAILTHSIFALVVNMLGSKIARLHSNTTENKIAGLTITGCYLRGLFNDMNPGAANPELFVILHNISTSFLVVKKKWSAESKALKKKKITVNANATASQTVESKVD